MANRVKRVDLSTDEVLEAIHRACQPYSTYIFDVIRRERYRTDRDMPHPQVIRRRLLELESLGLVKKAHQYMGGYYGQKWAITPAGEARLKEVLNGGSS